MTNAPTTRETADHIGKANEKVVQTPMHRDAAKAALALRTADHAELASKFEALAVEASAARNLGGAESMMVSIQTIYDLIASRNALLSEIAALRGERDRLHAEADENGLLAYRLTQAERQRDALLNAWRDDGIDLEDFGRIVARLANQGADQ